MAQQASRFIPALSFQWLTPFYDPLLRWGMREETFKHRLLKRANIQPGQHVLDLGCGTGTLALMLKESVPGAYMTGLDRDPQVLSLAGTKAERAGISIQWDQGMAYKLPYPDASFDAVVSSLVLHHLTSADKVRAFREVRRVLRPGGQFHALDFGRPFSALTRLQGAIMKNLERSADNFNGRILQMLREAGFVSPVEAEPMNTICGPIWFFEAVNAKESA